MPPPVERRQRLQDGILRIQKVAVVELGFRGAPGCFQGTWIYIGGRSRSVELRGAHEGGARPPASWLPSCVSDFHSKSPGSCLFQERSSRRFRSVWIPFDIPFLRNIEIGKKTAICTGPLVSKLVPKLIYKCIIKPIKHPKQII